MSGIERRIVDQVGSYLRNPERTPGVTCEVCTTPIDDGRWCRRCGEDRERFGPDLADLVVPVVYGGHNDQSKTLLYEYKTPPAGGPGDERQRKILLLLWVAVHRHRPCIERRAGARFDIWTTVPSTKGRFPHPLLEVARRAGLGPHELPSTPLSGQPADLRTTSADRFSRGSSARGPTRPDHRRHVDHPGTCAIACADSASRWRRYRHDRRACALAGPGMAGDRCVPREPPPPRLQPVNLSGHRQRLPLTRPLVLWRRR